MMPYNHFFQNDVIHYIMNKNDEDDGIFFFAGLEKHGICLSPSLSGDVFHSKYIFLS